MDFAIIEPRTPPAEIIVEYHFEAVLPATGTLPPGLAAEKVRAMLRGADCGWN